MRARIPIKKQLATPILGLLCVDLSLLALHKSAIVPWTKHYSKVSIIRPGRSFLKKNSTGRLIDTFSKYPDQIV